MNVRGSTILYTLLAALLLTLVVHDAVARYQAYFQNGPSQSAQVPIEQRPNKNVASQQRFIPAKSEPGGTSPEDVAFRTYRSANFGITFEYPSLFAVREVPARNAILVEFTDEHQTDYVYAFLREDNRFHLSPEEWFQKKIKPSLIIYATDEHLAGRIGDLYRFTGNVNPYLYNFAGSHSADRWVFSMNFEPHSVQDLISFYKILDSVRFFDQ